MRTNSIANMLSLALLLLPFASCKKDNSVDTAAATAVGSTTAQTAVAITQAVAVAAGRGTAGDSVYVVGTCAVDHHHDSVAFSSLPAAVTDYLTADYSSYTFQKAFTDKDTSGNTAGYRFFI